MPASTIPRRSIQTTEPFTNVHSITPAPKLSAGQTKSIDATMLRCPTTSTATSSPRSEQDNDNTSETSSTETMSAESCETFCTTRQYPSPSEKPCDSFPSSDDPPVHLDRIYQDNLCVEMLSLFEVIICYLDQLFQWIHHGFGIDFAAEPRKLRTSHEPRAQNRRFA